MIYKKKLRDVKSVNDNLIFNRNETKSLEVYSVTVAVNSQTLEDSHPNEREVYIILSGHGIAVIDNQRLEIEQGDIIYIPENCSHWIENPTDVLLQYICVAQWL